MAQQVHAAVRLLVYYLLCCCLLPAAFTGGGQKYNAMFSFGDSMADTGNICVNKSAADQLLLTFSHPPYGMTYFGHPSCRCSDGRIVVDFLAQALGLPLLPPSKLRGAGVDFRKGANMAIVGATALDFDFLKSIGLGIPLWNNGAMNVQIRWFRELLPSICGTPKSHSCKAYLAKSLFVFGSLGGNDYNAMLFFGVDQAGNYTPKIVDKIISGVEELIALGAMDIVVPGTLPIGCCAVFLALLPSANKTDYDEYGCLKPLNDLSVNHNSLLQRRLAGLRARHATPRIMYADYYTHITQMMHDPARFGFSSGITACCGAGGGKYNYDLDARCGMKGATACPNPSSHESWDGIHPTEAVNRLIAGGWLTGPYCHPPILQ